MARLLHPDEREVRERLEAAIERGTAGHYTDAVEYDHEYARRKMDVAFYLKVAEEHGRSGAILELGCGTGRLTAPLARAGHTVTGVDASAQMLAACRARIDRQGLGRNVRLCHGDFRTLADRDSPLGKERYPLVFCPFNAFQHLYEREEIEAFFAGVRAHLRPDGIFVFDVMNPQLSWLSRDSNRRWDRTRYKDPRSKTPMTYATQMVYDAPLQMAFVTIFHQRADKRGKTRRRHLTQRHFFPRELESLLHYNGLELFRREGDFDGEALAGDSEQQVLWCRLASPKPRSHPRKFSTGK